MSGTGGRESNPQAVPLSPVPWVPTAENPNSRLPKLPKLAGLAEVADLAGVSRTRAGQLAAHPWFPPPVQQLAMGPVWLEANVKTFLAIPRKAGRRSKTAPMEYSEFRWHVLSECPDEGPCPIHGLNRVADDDITCHACEQCGMFTLHDVGDGWVARCQNCGEEILLWPWTEDRG